MPLYTRVCIFPQYVSTVETFLSLSLPPSLRILPSYLFDPPSFRACRGQADGLSTLRRLTFCNIYPAHLFFRYYSVLSRRPPLLFLFFFVFHSIDRTSIDPFERSNRSGYFLIYIRKRPRSRDVTRIPRRYNIYRDTSRRQIIATRPTPLCGLTRGSKLAPLFQCPWVDA